MKEEKTKVEDKKRGDLSEARRKERKYVWKSEKDKRNGEQRGGVKTKGQKRGERDGEEFYWVKMGKKE